jgi:ATP-binding cassette subfamily G (WHITE) protein 2
VLKLRFGKKLSSEQRFRRSNEVVEELGLAHCADSMVGGAMRRGISGGELKRVSIGIELLSQPSVLYLDEPTSGLDSATARNLVETLVALASHGRTIVSCLTIFLIVTNRLLHFLLLYYYY